MNASASCSASVISRQTQARNGLICTGAICALAVATPGLGQPSAISAPRIITERIESTQGRAQADSIYGRLVKPTLTVNRTRGTLARLVYQRRDHTLIQQFPDGKALLWDLGQGTQCNEIRVPAGAAIVMHDGKAGATYVLHEQRLYVARAGADGKTSEEVLATDVGAATVNPPGTWIVAATADGTVLGFPLGAGDQRWSMGSAARNPAGIAASWDGARVAVLGRNGELAVVARDAPAVASEARISRLVGYDRSGRLRAVRGSALIAWTAPGAPPTQTPLTSAADTAYASDSGTAALELGLTGTRALRVAGADKVIDEDVADVGFIDDKLYVYAKSNGVTFLRATDKDYYLLSLIPSADGWVAVDHEGRYDGTVEGTKDVVWKAGEDVLTLDQFFDEFFRPGLVADYVNGRQQAMGALPAKVDQGIYLGPKVEIEFPEPRMVSGKEFRVVVVGTSRGGDLAPHLSLYHNGKRLAEKARLGSRVVKNDKNYLLVEVFAFSPSGGVNEVWAEARNVHGVAGRSDARKAVADGGMGRGSMRVIGVGINRYADPKLQLNNAVHDAESILQQVGLGATVQFRDAQPSLVTNAQATGQGIRDTLAALERAGPDDSIVLALVGHGVVVDDEWYFLPQDADIRRLKESSISARMLQDALVASPARQILVMLDACNSGGSIDDFNRYRNFQRRFAQLMSRSAGVTVLAATRRDQEALEFRDLGHGLFTYVLLEGLRGAADTAPKDNVVSAHELARYVGERLQGKARQMLAALGETVSSIQEPVYFSIGADFLLGRAAN